jgi:8-oxo-dGTP diphosphatase
MSLLERTRFWKMAYKPDTPKVGVGVLIVKGDKILLGLRKGAHGAGQWSLPGGHMELGESFSDVCAREVREETGIIIQGVKKMTFTNDLFEEDGLHYVTLFFEAKWNGKQNPKNLEPDKTEEWKWFDLWALPENLFPPLMNLLTGM